MCKNVGPSLQFVRKYGPAMRWYNSGLAVEKKPDAQGPLAMTIQVFKKNATEPVIIVPN